MKAAQAAAGRILAIDALRGIALMAMALDHTAASIGTSLQAETYGGQPAVLMGWPYWVSGLLTNLAAPAFWLLSGVSITLFAEGRRRQGESEWAITRFLLIRAGVITLLDLTVCQIAWAGRGPYLHVLTSIAVGLALMSVLRRLPTRLLAALLAAWVLGYQLFLPLIAARFSQTQVFWQALLLGFSTRIWPALEFSTGGWASLMGIGVLLGRGILSSRLSRARTWAAIGAALLCGWFALRLAGGFGDLVHFAAHDPWYNFLIMSKTPPSLSYLAFNLGWAALLMAALYARSEWLERIPLKWLVVCGQVSLFFFVAHIVVYGLLGRGMRALNPPGPAVVSAYLVWIAGWAILAPLAQAYRTLRRRYPRSPLRYL